MRMKFSFLITFLIMLLFAFTSCGNAHHEKDPVGIDSVGIKDTLHNDICSISKILEIRNQEINDHLCDSIYLNIPTISLIDILSRYGTNKDRNFIVTEYILNYNTRYKMLENNKLNTTEVPIDTNKAIKNESDNHTYKRR